MSQVMDQFDTKICDAEFGKICVPGLSVFQTLISDCVPGLLVFQTLISDHLDTEYRCDLHV